jgi:hypothetical protein
MTYHTVALTLTLKNDLITAPLSHDLRGGNI